MQHWLKVLHVFRGAQQVWVGDPHRINADGEPVMRPAFEAGDLLLVYVAGTHRCPGVVEVAAPPEFDPAQARWGWRTAVRLVVEAPLERAPLLEEEVGVALRSVGRQSRLRLRPEQFARGYEALLNRAAGRSGRSACR